jgi:membrane protein DedA with SNARE-associated domain
MTPAFAAALTSPRAILEALAAAAPAAATHPNPLIHLLLSFGIVGVFVISIVDSSFVPLPIPGITDILVVVLAAQHANVFFRVAASTFGSFRGGLFSYKVGRSGGMAFLEKHVPPRIFKRVRHWMETHAILSVALPAVLPPPMPLSPFVLAAGALKMSRNKFLATFTASRFLRHAFFAWLGIYYGRHVLRIWNMFTREYSVPILIAIWSIILLSAGIAFYRLWKTSRTVSPAPPRTSPTAPPAEA